MACSLLSFPTVSLLLCTQQDLHSPDQAHHACARSPVALLVLCTQDLYSPWFSVPTTRGSLAIFTLSILASSWVCFQFLLSIVQVPDPLAFLQGMNKMETIFLLGRVQVRQV